MKGKFLREQSMRLEKERQAKNRLIQKDVKAYVNSVDLYNEQGLNRLATAIFGEAYVKKYFQ